MQHSQAVLVQERRGHDRVQDAIYLHLGTQSQATPDRPNQKVSLSASGIAFADTGFYEVGTELDISIVLFPSRESIACRVQVVAAGDVPEVAKGDLPTYRAAFLDLSDEQVEILAEHVDQLLSSLSIASA